MSMKPNTESVIVILAITLIVFTNARTSSHVSFMSSYSTPWPEHVDKNIDRASNVVATLNKVSGGFLNQTQNNEDNQDTYNNAIDKGSRTLKVQNDGGNAVAGLRLARGNNYVQQHKNNNHNRNRVRNRVNKKNQAASNVFGVANTYGTANNITGNNQIAQQSNNNEATDTFSNF